MKPRILYVTHRVPWPPDRGDRIRTWNILKFLAARADVDLACLADEPVSDQTRNALQGVTSRLAIIPHSGKSRYLRGAWSLLTGATVTEGLFQNQQLARTITEWCRTTRYSATMASSSGIASYLSPAADAHQCRTWIDLIDVDSQKWLDYSASARFPMSRVYRTEGERLRQLEAQLATTSQRLLVVSEAERDLFRSFCPDAPIQAIGNGVDTDYFCPEPHTVIPHSCAFVGVMNYLPNVDGVRWFVDEVWPQVRQRFPAATFNIVGKSPTPEVQRLADRPGVSVTGSVPDVRPWLHKAGCVVVPLRIARGVQNKVLEAMACGRPLVCSPAPLNGLHVEPELQLLQATSVDDWVNQISRIFRNDNLSAELGTAASTWVQLNHRWESCLEPLSELLATSADSPQLQQAEVCG